MTMSKTSRIILWCVLIVVLAMCIVLYAAVKRPAAGTTYRDAGKTYAESLQPGDETPVIMGRDFTLAAPYSWTLTRENYNDAGTWPELTQSTGTPG